MIQPIHESYTPSSYVQLKILSYPLVRPWTPASPTRRKIPQGICADLGLTHELGFDEAGIFDPEDQGMAAVSATASYR